MMQVAKKIPQQKVGPDFLAASHFSISQEERWAPSHDPMAYKSTFKKDYPPLPLQKRERIPSPAPAGIMHKDNRYADHVSLTRSHFVEKPLPNEEHSDASYALRKTNFKMDSDKKLKSFQTTHKEYFPVRPLEEAKNSPLNGKTEWMKSHIPQGDKEKELWPQSDYKSKFLGEQNAGRRPIMRPLNVFGGPPTITGDPRTQHGQFNTTTKSEYVGRYMPRKGIDPVTRNRLCCSSIPQGDQEKCNHIISTQQDSFQKPVVTGYTPFNKEEAVNRLRRTTFQLGDRRTPGKLISTATESYAAPGLGDRSAGANLNMGKSSFPEGDLDPYRSHERISRTTNDYFYGNPALGIHNKKVDGSQLRTKSHVDLGVAKGKSFYETSMNSDYTAKTVPYKKVASGITTNSSIPLDYYAGETTMPTSWSDFPSHAGVPKLVPNPQALDNLKKSHIRPPIPGEQEFSTTHQRTYTPKSGRRQAVDSGKLQRSSVPLGTLHLYQ